MPSSSLTEANSLAFPTPIVSANPDNPYQQPRFRPSTSIGDVHLGTECVFFLVQNPDLQPGEKVQIVSTDKPQVVVLATISARKECEERFKDKTPWPNPSGFDTEKRNDNYVLDIGTTDLSHPRGYGIDVVHANNEIKLTKAKIAVGDLDGDGKSEYFRECTSNEGLHMTVWKGKPLSGTRIWHSYSGFGYDTEGTCQPADYMPVK